MRKIFAILLFAIFLFNHFGYRLLFNYAQQVSAIRLETSFDQNEYNEAELVTIKVPLSLPYLNNQQNFERVDGEITVKGKIFKYVKRRIVDGNLVLLCLPDHDKMRIETAKEEFFKYANDLVQSSHSKKSGHSKMGQFKSPTGEYDNCVNRFAANCPVSNVVFNYPKDLDPLPTSPHTSPDQPPELS